ncbi:MAG: PAS domain S-box protein [Rhodothermia bacterium]|nr:PAS domain S-box protein [Rhodothermia bacterium]
MTDADTLMEGADAKPSVGQDGRRLDRVRLLRDVAIAANEAHSVQDAFEFALRVIGEFTGWRVGHAFVKEDPDGPVKVILGPMDERYEVIRRATVEGGFDPTTGLIGRVFESGVAEWIPDVREDPRFMRNDLVGQLNVGAAISFPVMAQNEVVAVMDFFAAEVIPPNTRLLDTMTIVGTQLGRVIERERVRHQLLDRDRKLLAAQRIAGLGYWEWSPVTGRLHWTDQLFELYGLDPSDGIDYEKYLSCIHEDDRGGMMSVIEKAMGDHRSYSHVHRIVRPDGSVRYIQGNGTVDVDEDGQVVRMSGTALDITRLKNAELEVRLAEERTRALTDSAVEAIVTIDDAGCIVGWNESATRIFGYELEEIEGESLTRMMPDRYHNAHTAGLYRAATSGEHKLIGKTIEIVGRRKSGEEFPIELSLSTWEVGGRSYFGGIIRDISERKRVEAELVEKSEQLRRLAARLQKVREEERSRLSREVHDLLGQALTGLRMDVAMIERLVPEQLIDTLRSRLDTMKDGIDETVHVVRRISSDLRPGVLDDLGIEAALEWEMMKYQHRTGVACNFDDLTDGGGGLDANQSTAVFRVFQELLTNVARHADASSVTASIERENGEFVMVVEDDGVGIGKSVNALSSSLGVLGMRERLAPWGGEIEFLDAPSGGTRVVVTLPTESGNNV